MRASVREAQTPPQSCRGDGGTGSLGSGGAPAWASPAARREDLPPGPRPGPRRASLPGGPLGAANLPGPVLRAASCAPTARANPRETSAHAPSPVWKDLTPPHGSRAVSAAPPPRSFLSSNTPPLLRSNTPSLHISDSPPHSGPPTTEPHSPLARVPCHCSWR